MSDFTFRGKKASEFGLIVQSKQRPLVPGIKTSYIDIPGRDGSIDFSRHELEDRIIEVTCYLSTSSISDLREYSDNITKWLMGTALINNQSKLRNNKDALIFDDAPTKIYNAKIANQINFEQTITLGEFTIQFRCDPLPIIGSYSEQISSPFGNANINYTGVAKSDPYIVINSTDIGTGNLVISINELVAGGYITIYGSEIALDYPGYTIDQITIDISKYKVYVQLTSLSGAKTINGLKYVALNGDLSIYPNYYPDFSFNTVFIAVGTTIFNWDININGSVYGY